MAASELSFSATQNWEWSLNSTCSSARLCSSLLRSSARCSNERHGSSGRVPLWATSGIPWNPNESCSRSGRSRFVCRHRTVQYCSVRSTTCRRSREQLKNRPVRWLLRTTGSHATYQWSATSRWELLPHNGYTKHRKYYFRAFDSLKIRRWWRPSIVQSRSLARNVLRHPISIYRISPSIAQCSMTNNIAIDPGNSFKKPPLFFIFLTSHTLCK